MSGDKFNKKILPDLKAKFMYQTWRIFVVSKKINPEKF
ncbi:MAG: hypothetical protein BWX51_01988 [Bacteroidetes bacterium ADurb.Bin012]|jgi:hypothetical protein|nr:MAG: hypothetical protein BWX51_01988 [Bacteroidetes bacterium ADurb.Bin012]